MLVTFPRFILAELNTHRMFSRNSASSRAIPFKKMVESVTSNPFVPMAWQTEHKGMQGTNYITDPAVIAIKVETWLAARDAAVSFAQKLSTNEHLSNGGDYWDERLIEQENTGATKQLCNRLLEPFMYHTVLVTSTEWENFFALRCPRYQTPVSQTIEPQRSWEDLLDNHSNPENLDKLDAMDTVGRLQLNKGQAEIHMMALAEAMWDAFNCSTPKELKAGEWHIPFGDQFNPSGDNFLYGVEDAELKVATARCARVSYTVAGEEGKPANYQNDINLHDRLSESGHWSPFEHCAQSMTQDEYDTYFSGRLVEVERTAEGEPYTALEPTDEGIGFCGNFRGFIQYRKKFANENITV